MEKTRHLKNYFTALLRDERGQTTTEYVMILALVVMIAMKFKTTFVEGKLKSIIDNLGNQMDSAITISN